MTTMQTDGEPARQALSILLIEDESRVADFIVRGLRAEGWLVNTETDGHAGLALALEGGFDVIVLDVMLPGLSGKDVCRMLRAHGTATPILMLTALASVEQRVEGLRMGADDYLGKPFSFDELIARIEALGRRVPALAPSGALRCGPLSFDPATMETRCAGVEVPLTGKERELLRLLLGNPGRVFSRERILNAVWGVNEDPLTNVVDVYIARLRRKLGASGDMIETVRGAGYRLNQRDTERRTPSPQSVSGSLG